MSTAKTKQISLERTFKASLEEVWELWTTKEGVESWWGPEGFSVEVKKLDLRTGGRLDYTMSASGPQQIEFMKKAGMALSRDHTFFFTEVTPPTRLAYHHGVDFVPDVAPYQVSAVVELRKVSSGVQLLVTLDPMHDDVWTERSVAGWNSQLGKLEKLIAARR